MKIFMRKTGSKTRKCDIIKCIRKNIRTFVAKIQKYGRTCVCHHANLQLRAIVKG